MESGKIINKKKNQICTKKHTNIDFNYFFTSILRPEHLSIYQHRNKSNEHADFTDKNKKTEN